MMSDADIADRSLSASFHAVKNALAKLMGVKRVQSGADFVEEEAVTAPFVGKRQHNMGDLWREQSG